MSHRVGIVASGVVALLGSLLLLAMCLLSLYIGVAPSKPAVPPEARGVMYLGAAVLLIGAAWGISTAIGLFRRARWSRISILIFSFMLMTTSTVSGLAIAFMPMPPPTGSQVNMAGIRAGAAGFYGVLALLSLVWAVYFTRPGVKAEFGAPAARTDPRPLSIVVIGWWLMVAAFFVLPSMLLGLPAMFLGGILHGWTARLFYLAFGAISFYAGRGLLRLDVLSRKVAIGYFLFSAFNALLFYVVPGNYDLMLQSLPKWFFPGPSPHAAQGFTFGIWFGVMVTIVGIVVPLWFLVTRRAAFSPHSA